MNPIVFFVNYNNPPCPDDGPQYPVLSGCAFLYRGNAEAHAAKNPGSTIELQAIGDENGWTLEHFDGEVAP